MVIECRDCLFPFTLSDEATAFFDRQGLSRPTRCGACRAQRRAAMLEGTITFFDPGGFGFIETADGRRFYYTRSDFGAHIPPLCRGLRVSFMPTPANPTPRARRARVLDSVESGRSGA